MNFSHGLPQTGSSSLPSEIYNELVNQTTSSIEYRLTKNIVFSLGEDFEIFKTMGYTETQFESAFTGSKETYPWETYGVNWKMGNTDVISNYDFTDGNDIVKYYSLSKLKPIQGSIKGYDKWVKDVKPISISPSKPPRK